MVGTHRAANRRAQGGQQKKGATFMTVTSQRLIVQRRKSGAQQVGSIEQVRTSTADTIRPSTPGGSGSADALPPPPTSQADANPAVTH